MTPHSIPQLIDELVYSWNATGKAAEVGLRRIEARVALEHAITQLAAGQPACVPQAADNLDLLGTLKIAGQALWQASNIPEANCTPVAKHVQAVINETEYARMQNAVPNHNIGLEGNQPVRWNPDAESGCSYS